MVVQQHTLPLSGNVTQGVWVGLGLLSAKWGAFFQGAAKLAWLLLLEGAHLCVYVCAACVAAYGAAALITLASWARRCCKVTA